MGRMLREPLLHFLLIGLALFLYYGRVAPGRGDQHRIIVGQAQVDDLTQQFKSTWSRSPTPEELRGLVDSFVHDEILYREGEALGLGRDDVVIKRRVRQKLEVMAEEELARAAPTDAELSAYLDAHAPDFAVPAVVSFDQVYFQAKGTDADIERGLARARSELAHGASPERVGQPTLLPARVETATGADVAREFGQRFADTLATLPVGSWQGPVVSEFGVHLVRVSSRTDAARPTLDAVRAQVTREWENAERHRALGAAYAKLRQQYEVRVEANLPAGTGK